jgi:hypothetical protein
VAGKTSFSNPRSLNAGYEHSSEEAFFLKVNERKRFVVVIDSQCFKKTLKSCGRLIV